MSRPLVHPHCAEPEPMLPPFGPMAAALPTRRANPLLLRKSWHWAFARRADPSGEGALGHELVERAAVVWAGSGRDDVQRERGGAGIREDSRCKRPRGGEIVAQPFDEAALSWGLLGTAIRPRQASHEREPPGSLGARLLSFHRCT